MKVSKLWWTLAVGLVMVVGFVLDRTVLDDEAASSTDDTTQDDGTTGPDDDRDPPSRYSDLPLVTLDQLPSEALDTLALIEAGGPYPYRPDDSTFQNREGILPAKDHGHYREYTVETPGSSDRGARRIVTGADGERYWTDDHYDSFFEIVF